MSYDPINEVLRVGVSAGVSAVDAARFGLSFVVKLFLDPKSPFAKRLPKGQLFLSWELRPKMPLHDVRHLESFLESLDEDTSIASKLDMNLMYFCKRSSDEEVELDGSLTVAELGIEAGDELVLRLRMDAVRKKQKVLSGETLNERNDGNEVATDDTQLQQHPASEEFQAPLHYTPPAVFAQQEYASRSPRAEQRSVSFLDVDDEVNGSIRRVPPMEDETFPYQDYSLTQSTKAPSAGGSLQEMLMRAKQQSSVSTGSSLGAGDTDEGNAGYNTIGTNDNAPEFEEGNDESLSPIAALMKASKQNRMAILDGYEKHIAELGPDIPEEYDEEGNPIVLLPNIEDYLLELENEEVELELHEVSNQLKDFVKNQLTQLEEEVRRNDLETAKRNKLLYDGLRCQLAMDQLILHICRKQMLREKLVREAQLEQQWKQKLAEDRAASKRGHPHNPFNVEDSAASRATSRATSVAPTEDTKTAEVSLLDDVSHKRFNITALGERLQRDYLPSVLDLL